tara:strand:+ start:13708 stop:14415 length:708 start_codon:yes stop_codon:yes gene_type:complete
MANTGDLVSIKLIADRLMRNPILKDLTWEFIVDNAIEVLRILEAPSLFVNRSEGLEVKDFRAMKPVDIMKINGISKIEGNALSPLTANQDVNADDYPGMQSLAVNPEGTYSLNSRYIITNFETGKILISYKAIATDEECYPLILNNAVLLRCVESYIKWKWFDILNDMDMISDRKLNKAETDYCFNVAQADANLKLPSIDEMEALVNQITQLLPDRSAHASRFEFLGSKERIRIQ